MTIDAYEKLPLRATLNQLMELQSNDALSDSAISNNAAASFSRDKIFSVANLLTEAISKTPASLASNHSLSLINKHLQAVLNEAKAFISNKNPQHLINASTHVDQHLIPSLPGFSALNIERSGDGLSEVISTLSKSSRQTIKAITEEKDRLATNIREAEALANELKDQIKSIADNAAKERAEAMAAVAKLEQAFAERETARANAFDSEIKKIKADYTNLDKSIKASDTARSKSFDEKMAAIQESHAAMEKTAKESADQLINSLSEQQNRAAQIVQVVGNIGVTGNYQRIATTEEKQANFWRWATVLFFSGGVLLAGATFYRFWGEPITSESLWSIAIRLLYAIAITAPAIYTARESARHRTNSDRARQTELELASLGPFIELMPPEKKIEIREQMTKLYFGQKIEAHTAKSLLDAEAVKDFAIELAKIIKK